MTRNGDTSNDLSGTADSVVQARDTGPVTIINGATGPIHTGAGHQFNGQLTIHTVNDDTEGQRSGNRG